MFVYSNLKEDLSISEAVSIIYFFIFKFLTFQNHADKFMFLTSVIGISFFKFVCFNIHSKFRCT